MKERSIVTGPSIYVVEDDGIIALRSHELLTKEGYDVPHMFATGEELLDQLERSDPPDLILMDIGLGGKIDGIETACRVRERYTTPIIFLTAYGDEKRIERAQKTLHNGYIIKPFAEHQLLEGIRTALLTQPGSANFTRLCTSDCEPDEPDAKSP
jgi:CheY-like chemotaxis protein